MTTYDPTLEAKARSWAKTRLSEARFRHTEGVVEMATRLAHRFNVPETASLRLAGWIHDAAKERGDDELLALAKRLGYTVRPVEKNFPFLLHGVVAGLLAREELGIHDPVVATAVEYHTTGHPDMSLADKVFFLADLAEPSRAYPWIDQVRRLAQEDVDTALLFAVTYQLRRLLKRGSAIDPRAIELRNSLLLAGVPLVPRRKKHT